MTKKNKDVLSLRESDDGRVLPVAEKKPLDTPRLMP